MLESWKPLVGLACAVVCPVPSHAANSIIGCYKIDGTGRFATIDPIESAKSQIEYPANDKFDGPPADSPATGMFADAQVLSPANLATIVTGVTAGKAASPTDHRIQLTAKTLLGAASYQAVNLNSARGSSQSAAIVLTVQVGVIRFR